jgi:hypothetical protein
MMPRIEVRKDLLVEVVLASATGSSCTGSITLVKRRQMMSGSRQRPITYMSHAAFPPIIFSNGQQDVTTIALQKEGKVCSTGLDIKVLANGEDDHSQIGASENSQCLCSCHSGRRDTFLG